MKTVFVLLSLSLLITAAVARKSTAAASQSKTTLTERQSSDSCIDFLEMKFHFFFFFWWWTLSAPRHLITFWWARKSKLYTTWKPGLSWEASIDHHDSVFVCHLCRMKQVRFSSNQYSCPLLLWNSTRFTRTCSRNCGLKHIFTVVVHSNLVAEWIQWRHWQSINLLPSVDIKSEENTILTFRCLNTLMKT